MTTIGQLIDGLGVTSEPPEQGDLIDSCVVLLKSIDGQGRAVLQILTSPQMDWITQIGIIEAARCIIQTGATDDD